MSSRFIPSSRKNPCLICGRIKDADCRLREAGNLILCHTLQDAVNEPNTQGYKFLRRSDEAAGYGVWIWQGDKPIKPERPKKKVETVYYYHHRNGNLFVRVIRTDSENGKNFRQEHHNGTGFVSGMAEDRASTPIYRYKEVQDAIKQGKPIFWVEGEKVADLLWSIGIAATTSIGGSKAYRNYGNGYKDDLKGATVILMPDRDEAGLDYIKEVAKDFPEAKYCKVFPKSPLWNHIPKSGGLDAADWIQEGATAADIMAAVCDDLFGQPAKPAYELFLEKVDKIYEQYQGNQREFYLEELARESRRTLKATKAYYRSWKNEGIGKLPVSEGLDFLDEPIPDNEWLIADLLPKGVTVMLPATPGAGKTTFAYSIAYSVISGTNFGDRPVQKGKVLILQGDDSRSRTHRLLSALGFGELPKDSWYIYRNFDFTMIDRLDDFIGDHGISLVICDSYSKLNHYSPYEEKDPGFADPLVELAALADRHNCSFIAIHHFNKGGTTRGTTALEANADEVWYMTKESNRPDRMLTHGKSRSDVQGTYLVAYDQESKRACLEIPPGEDQPATTGDRIKAHLETHPNIWYEAIELIDLPKVGTLSINAVYKALMRLAEKGYISQEKRTRQTSTGDRDYSVFCFKKLVVEGDSESSLKDSDRIQTADSSYGF